MHRQDGTPTPEIRLAMIQQDGMPMGMRKLHVHALHDAPCPTRPTEPR